MDLDNSQLRELVYWVELDSRFVPIIVYDVGFPFWVAHILDV